MLHELENIVSDKELTEEERFEHQKKLLALDALSKLVGQFSAKPDIENVLDSLLFTFSGQFAVTSAFIYLSNVNNLLMPENYFGIGRYKSKDVTKYISIDDVLTEFFLKHNKAFKISDLKSFKEAENLATIFEMGEIAVVVPLIHNNNLLGIAGLSQKINEREITESELRMLATISQSVTPFISNIFLFSELSNLNNWYHDILNSVDQSVMVFDEQLTLRKVNNSALDIITCLKPDVNADIAEFKFRMDEVFPESHFKGWLKKIKIASSSSDSVMLENMVAKCNDEELIFKVVVSSLTNGLGNRNDIVVTLIDITNQVLSEHHLFELEKFADKGVMASSISHELNNFLALLSAGVEIAEMNIKKDKIDKTSETLVKLKEHVHSMTRFTAGLMDFTRLNTKKEMVNLKIIVEDVLSFLNVHRKFKNLNIATSIDDNIPDMLLDKDQISQLLLNVLNNAADAIKEAKRETGEIVVKIILENKKVILSIADNGTGIDPEVKDKLFEAQFTTKKDGHGYGLVTCGKIIKNHDIITEIDSIPNGGTNFKFSIPL